MPNKIYQHDETAVVWAASGGTELWTPTSLATNTGRQGALHDFGTAARSGLFVARVAIVPGATRVVGEPFRLYIKTSDGTYPDNDDGTGDIAVSSSDKLRNLSQIMTILIDENAAVPMVRSILVQISARYAGPVGWNGTANTLSATAADFFFSLTPVPDEIQ